MTNFNKLRLIYLVSHLALIPATVFGSLFHWVIAVGMYLVLQVIGVGIGLHRYLAHKSFETNSFFHYFITFTSVLSCVGSPMSWAAVHRLHHQTADKKDDPHSPLHLGMSAVLLGHYNSNISIRPRYVRDMLKSKWLCMIHKYYFKILLCTGGLLLLIGWDVLVFGWLVPIVFVYWANALGIFLNHSWGYRNHDTDDLSCNNWLLSVYTLGDGWHNNHHRFPSRYVQGEKWWEFDLCALLIRYCFAKSLKSTVNE